MCSLTLKAGSICQDISERVLGAIKESQYIGHQHGGSLSHSPRDLSPSQGHTSGPKSISFGNPRQPLFICDSPGHLRGRVFLCGFLGQKAMGALS